MIDGSLNLPLYHQVAAVLRQRIVNAEYPSGDRLASEDELAAEFAVSRATIRQAVGSLVSEGLVVRKQGSGTYVQDLTNAVLRQRFRGSLDDLIRESHSAAPRDLHLEHDVHVPPSVSSALEIDSSTATVVQRTRMIEDEPFAYTVTYLPNDLGSRITAERMDKLALMEILIQDGVKLASATQSIRPQLADARLGSQLDTVLGAPVLYVERTVRDDSGRPVEFVKTWYRGDRYEFTVTLDLTDETQSRFRGLA